MVDARDLKSLEALSSYEFKSRPGHQKTRGNRLIDGCPFCILEDLFYSSSAVGCLVFLSLLKNNCSSKGLRVIQTIIVLLMPFVSTP